MKVKELKHILAHFSDNDIVRVAHPRNNSAYVTYCVDDVTKAIDGIALWVESQNPMGKKIKKAANIKTLYKN